MHLGRRWQDFDPYMLITTMVLMGFDLMLVVVAIDYRFFAALAWPIYGIGLVLLVLVLVPGWAWQSPARVVGSTLA